MLQPEHHIYVTITKFLITKKIETIRSEKMENLTKRLKKRKKKALKINFNIRSALFPTKMTKDTNSNDKTTKKITTTINNTKNTNTTNTTTISIKNNIEEGTKDTSSKENSTEEYSTKSTEDYEVIDMDKKEETEETSSMEHYYDDKDDAKYLFCSELVAIVYKSIGMIPPSFVSKFFLFYAFIFFV